MIGDLIVGDIHAKKNNLEETSRLWDWIISIAVDRSARIVLLGDIFNDFGLTHIEVLTFWAAAGSKAVASGVDVSVVVGNHDMSPDGSYNFPAFLSSIGFDVHDKPGVLGSDLFMPFYRNGDEFVKDLNDLYKAYPQVSNVYCHQEFNGCQFENGFYAPSGVMPDLLPQSLNIISGHIHKRQILGNIHYPGTPRWLTRSDANEKKGIFYWGTSGLDFIPTPESVCEPIKLFTLEQGCDLNSKAAELKGVLSSKCYIDIIGDKKFVSDALKKDWGEAKVKTIVKTDYSRGDIAESQGISSAFSSYFVDYIAQKQLGKKEANTIWSLIHPYIPTETQK